MQEIQAEKASQYVPKSQMNQTLGGKQDSARAGVEKDLLSKTMMPAMNTTINSAMMGNMQGSGVDYKQIKFMSDMLQDHENRLEQILDLLDEKMDKPNVEALISDKIGKEEITDLLPDMNLYEQKVRTQIEENIDELWLKLEEKFMGWDQRMISIRNDFDMTELKKFIDTKANKENVAGDFQNHEFKIGTLDKNIVAIASDFETFQQAINRMHAVVLELQEANKDVLVGKRNLNCLSCGIKDGQSQGIPSTQQSTFYGRDGRIYRGGANANATLEMAEGGIMSH